MDSVQYCMSNTAALQVTIQVIIFKYDYSFNLTIKGIVNSGVSKTVRPTSAADATSLGNDSCITRFQRFFDRLRNFCISARGCLFCNFRFPKFLPFPLAKNGTQNTLL